MTRNFQIRLENCREIQIRGTSGKRYLRSLKGKEYYETYDELGGLTNESFYRKFRQMRRSAPCRLSEVNQVVICDPINIDDPVNGHFELEIILEGVVSVVN